MPHLRHDIRGVDYSCFKGNNLEQEIAEMTTDQKRQWLAALYPKSKTWTERVKHMADDQVTAIYLRKISKQNNVQPKERAS